MHKYIIRKFYILRRRTGEYSKRLHTMPETACTEKKLTPDDELPEARNM